MNRQQIALKLLIEEVNVPRVPVKYVVYFLQCRGIPLGYKFEWYPSGFGSESAYIDYCFHIDGDCSGWVLPEYAKKIAQEVKSMLLMYNTNFISKTATVLFMFKTGQGKNIREIYEKLSQAETLYSILDVQIAWETLVDYGFINENTSNNSHISFDSDSLPIHTE